MLCKGFGISGLVQESFDRGYLLLETDLLWNQVSQTLVHQSYLSANLGVVSFNSAFNLEVLISDRILSLEILVV